jgi:hypothetical protein
MLGTYRDDVLDSIAQELLEFGMEYLRKFNRDISRYYELDVRNRQLKAIPSATFLQFVNHGRGRVTPKNAKCLAWRDRDSGQMVFRKSSKAYFGSHYKEKLEIIWQR